MPFVAAVSNRLVWTSFSDILVLEILAFSFTLWLGAYLIARNPRSRKLSLAGIGLIAFALALATDVLAQSAATGHHPEHQPPLAITVTGLILIGYAVWLWRLTIQDGIPPATSRILREGIS